MNIRVADTSLLWSGHLLPEERGCWTLQREGGGNVVCINYNLSIDHKSDHIMEKTDMPDELVRDVQGIPIFEQVLMQVRDDFTILHSWTKLQ